MHSASTFQIDSKVRRAAHILQDEKFISKLSVGDVVAVEAKYHSQCLVELYNQAAKLERPEASFNENSMSHGLALAELITFIEDTKQLSDVSPVFRLSELAARYEETLASFGVTDNAVNVTHLKNRILAQLPTLRAQKSGRNILLIFDEDIGIAIKSACVNGDDDAIVLLRAANILRRDMLTVNSSFTGTFNDNCQDDSVPQSLISMVCMILSGTGSKAAKSNQTVLSLSQLLQFNCIKKQSSTHE